MLLVEQERRHGENGIWLTGRQFTAMLASILSVQLAVNWFAAQSFVKEVAVEVVRSHNTDTEAHARALLLAQQERHDMIRQIVVLQTKIDGLEAMIRNLAVQGVFNTTNGKPK